MEFNTSNRNNYDRNTKEISNFSTAISSIETSFSNWLTASFILLTLALILYNISTNISDKNHNRLVIKYVSIFIILISCIMSIICIFPYYTRLSRLLAHLKKYSHESTYQYIYMILAILIIFIELIIASMIIFFEFDK